MLNKLTKFNHTGSPLDRDLMPDHFDLMVLVALAAVGRGGNYAFAGRTSGNPAGVGASGWSNLASRRSFHNSEGIG